MGIVEDNSRLIVIAGGRGFVGTSLAEHLTAAGARVVVLSRRRSKMDLAIEQVHWDGRTLGPWTDCLEGAAGLVNLAGRSVDCIKTPDHQDEILRSRVESSRVLGQALRSVASPPPVWVQMSTAHIYGDPPSARCTEESPFGLGLAPAVGRAWEEEFHASALPDQRQVILRTSFVLGRDQGAGAQGVSWIHELDLNRMIEHALSDSRWSGPYIASSPNPVAQREFARELRRAVRAPIALPAYEWMVRFGARWVLRTDPELALYGRYVASERIEAEDFRFQFPDLRDALDDLLSRRRT